MAKPHVTDWRCETIYAGERFTAPQAPHDDLSFKELARRYNFEQTSVDQRVFARLIIKECQTVRAAHASNVCVLDVGCGRGIARRAEYQWAIRPHVDEYWGLSRMIQ